MKYQLTILSFFICSLMFAAPPITYQIKFSHKDYPGKKYRLKKTDGTFYNMTHLNSDGKITFTKTSNKLLEFEGDIQIIKVNDKDIATEIIITVIKCIFSDKDKDAKVIIAEGKKVRLYMKDAKPVYAIDNLIFDNDTQKILERIFSLGDVNSNISDDDIWGSKEAKAIGDSWDMDKTHLAKYFKLLPKKMKGTATLEGLEKVNEEKCLKIVTKTHVDDFNKIPPTGFKLEKDTLDCSMTYYIPVSNKPKRKQLERMFFNKIAKKIDSKGKTEEIILETFSTFNISYYKWELSNKKNLLNPPSSGK